MTSINDQRGEVFIELLELPVVPERRVELVLPVVAVPAASSPRVPRLLVPAVSLPMPAPTPEPVVDPRAEPAALPAEGIPEAVAPLPVSTPIVEPLLLVAPEPVVVEPMPLDPMLPPLLAPAALPAPPPAPAPAALA